MKLKRLCAVLAIALLFPCISSAKSKLPKVMVLDLTHDAALSPATATTLDGFLAGAVRNQGFTVITPSQVVAVLGVEKQRQLLGCSESGCLAEIGGALGVDFIVQGSIAQFSKNSAITLTLVDGKNGLAMAAQQKVVEGKDAENFIPAIQELVPRLMKAAKAPPDLTSTPSATPPAGDLSSNEVDRGVSSGHPTGSYVLLGTGVALIAASVVVGLMANSKASDVKNNPNDYAAASSAQSSAKNLALISTIGTGAGVLAAGGGLIWYFGGAQ